jgi:uncharacterized protein (DUF58 family)
LRSGDLFGFVSREKTLEMVDKIVVYPHIVSIDELGLPARSPLGEQSIRSWISEDVSRIAGAREYRPGDSLSRIHWPATARTGALQAKFYEATATHKIVIFLNLDLLDPSIWGFHYDSELLESTITTGASLAIWGLRNGYQVGIYTNGHHSGILGNVQTPPAGGPQQEIHILTILGRLQPRSTRGLEEVIRSHSRHLPYGATVVVVSAWLSRSVSSAIQSLRSQGFAPNVILFSRTDAVLSLTGVPVRHLKPPSKGDSQLSLSSAGNTNEHSDLSK